MDYFVNNHDHRGINLLFVINIRRVPTKGLLGVEVTTLELFVRSEVNVVFPGIDTGGIATLVTSFTLPSVAGVLPEAGKINF